MSAPYTPETIDVKMAYVTSFDPAGVHKFLAHMVAEMTTGHAADFDRWLKAHDQEVREKSLQPFFDLRLRTDTAPFEALTRESVVRSIDAALHTARQTPKEG